VEMTERSERRERAPELRDEPRDVDALRGRHDRDAVRAEPRVRVAGELLLETRDEHARHLAEQARKALDELIERLGRDAHELAVAHGPRGRVARLPDEETHLADEIAGRGLV